MELEPNLNGEHPFEILGIKPTSDKKTIKKAYAKLIKIYKPEKYPKEYQIIREAYDQLKDGYFYINDLNDEEIDKNNEENFDNNEFPAFVTEMINEIDSKTMNSFKDVNMFNDDYNNNSLKDENEIDQNIIYVEYSDIKEFLKNNQIISQSTEVNIEKLYFIILNNDLTYENLLNYGADENLILSILQMRWEAFLINDSYILKLFDEIEAILKNQIEYHLYDLILKMCCALIWINEPKTNQIMKLIETRYMNSQESTFEEDFETRYHFIESFKKLKEMQYPSLIEKLINYTTIIESEILFYKIFVPLYETMGKYDLDYIEFFTDSDELILFIKDVIDEINYYKELLNDEEYEKYKNYDPKKLFKYPFKDGRTDYSYEKGWFDRELLRDKVVPIIYPTRFNVVENDSKLKTWIKKIFHVTDKSPKLVKIISRFWNSQSKILDKISVMMEGCLTCLIIFFLLVILVIIFILI